MEQHDIIGGVVQCDAPPIKPMTEEDWRVVLSHWDAQDEDV
jgi:hypothetical protein